MTRTRTSTLDSTSTPTLDSTSTLSSLISHRLRARGVSCSVPPSFYCLVVSGHLNPPLPHTQTDTHTPPPAPPLHAQLPLPPLPPAPLTPSERPPHAPFCPARPTSIFVLADRQPTEGIPGNYNPNFVFLCIFPLQGARLDNTS